MASGPISSDGSHATAPLPLARPPVAAHPALSARGPLVLALAALGLAVRLLFVIASPGTLDVGVWQGHAREIERLGLVAYYGGGEFIFNHPPLAGWLVHGLYTLSEHTGLPFAAWLRAPFALLDALTAWGLVALAATARDPRTRERRFLLGAAYWASPLAMIFSAQHGNTDSVVACSLVAALLARAHGRFALSGLALGLGAWIKIPGLLAAPALLFTLPDLRARLQFSAALGASVLAGFAPALVQDARATVESVFLYSGLRIQTTTGMPIFGPQVFYPDPASLAPAARRGFVTLANAYYRADGLVVTGLCVAYAALRRRHRTTEGLAFTIAHGYALIYAFTNFFAFQYFAWALPLWLLAGWPLAVVGQLLCSAYVWGLYAWLCDHPLLLDRWRFIARPDWPIWIRALRDACVAFFIVLGSTRIVQAAREEWSRARRLRGNAGTPEASR